jgi:putative two-component system response regulator
VDARRSTRAAVTPSGHGGRILVVDDDRANRRLMTRLLERAGHAVISTQDGGSAFAVVKHERPDLVLLDVIMPGISGFDVCRMLKRDPSTRLTPVVLVTALTGSHDRIHGLEAGADDFLSKPVNAEELEARVRSLVRLKRHTDDLDSADSVIVSMALTIEARDAYTEGHCERLAAYATMLGRSLGLIDEDLLALRRGGFLHDIGKIGVPDSVLLKRARLSDDEYRIVQQHTVIGERLCGQLRSLERVRPIIRHHHERLDGSGYPDGLRGDAIPLLAQVMNVVDIYDALTTARPYKEALPRARACEELAAEATKGWRQPDLVAAFISLVDTPTRPVAESAQSAREVGVHR